VSVAVLTVQHVVAGVARRGAVNLERYSCVSAVTVSRRAFTSPLLRMLTAAFAPAPSMPTNTVRRRTEHGNNWQSGISNFAPGRQRARPALSRYQYQARRCSVVLGCHTMPSPLWNLYVYRWTDRQRMPHDGIAHSV